MATIIYTHTDEAPLLATYSFLPIVSAYAHQAGVEIETRDISLAGRILAQFGLADDALAELGELTERPEANIVKLPNISASVPQLKAAVKELQAKGYDLPDYPESPKTPEQAEIRARYGKAIGSVVNPVLRQGNSDRRAPLPVKAYARKHPSVNKPFGSGSKTSVATMDDHDFRNNEKSVTLPADDTLTIVLETTLGERKVLIESLPVLAGEVVDATIMQAGDLRAFLRNAVATAKAEDVLFSVHLKATMMRVSDPIIFGHAVKAYFAEVFDKYGDDLAAAGLSANDGLGSILAGLRCAAERRRDQGRIRVRAVRGPAAVLRQLRQGDHQPARPERRHRGRFHAGHDPQRRQAVGRGRLRGRHPRGHPRLRLRRGLRRPSSTT